MPADNYHDHSTSALSRLFRVATYMIGFWTRLTAGRGSLGPSNPAIDVARFLAMFAATYWIAFCLMRWPSPAWNDLLEAWAWGAQLQLGYHKHPPFYSWVTYAWFQVFPRADWASYLLSITNVVVGLAGVWTLSGFLAMPPRTRLLSVALLTLTPPYNLMASNYGADTALLSIWPWTIYAFVRSIEERSTVNTILFGALAAAALLSKYSSVLMLISCFVAALLHPAARAYFRWHGPYLAMAVCAVLCLPHLFWALGEGAPTLKYALERMTGGRTWLSRVSIAPGIGLAALAILAVPSATLWFVLGRRRIAVLWARRVQATARVPLWLWVLALGPAGLTLLLGLFGIASIILNFFIPTYFLLSLLVLLVFEPALSAERARRAMVPAFVFPMLAIVTAPAIAYGTVAFRIKETGNVTAEAAHAARAIWLRKVRVPVVLVGGTKEYALAAAFYLPEAPKYVSIFSFAETPWVRASDVARDGILIICEDDDRSCRPRVTHLAKRDLHSHHIQLERRFLGAHGGDKRISIYIIPPAD